MCLRFKPGAAGWKAQTKPRITAAALTNKMFALTSSALFISLLEQWVASSTYINHLKENWIPQLGTQGVFLTTTK